MRSGHSLIHSWMFCELSSKGLASDYLKLQVQSSPRATRIRARVSIQKCGGQFHMSTPSYIAFRKLIYIIHK